jgi:hypothetical protein
MPSLSRILTLVPGFLFAAGIASSDILDWMILGDEASESGHELQADRSEVLSGLLGEKARRLLSGGAQPWQGGTLKFSLKVNPEAQNYFTIRLTGDEVSHNQLTLHLDGRQIGYRHLGDIEALDVGTDAPAYPGRFMYRTNPLPLSLTKGRQEVSLEIRATGPIWGYGTKFEQYQKPMVEPTRGIYRVYSHTDGCFTPPSDEKQGTSPEKPGSRPSPGPEVMEALKARVNGQIDGLLKDPKRPANQMQTLFLTKATFENWTRAHDRPEALEKIQVSLDALYQAYVKNPKLAEAEPSTYNPDWFGLGPSGWVLDLLAPKLSPAFDEMIDNGMGAQVKRRDAYRDMLVACRDWHREHRRLYTNQTMINDLYGIYLANRGVAAVSPADALPEDRALRYLYESVGLEPWLGGEKDGKPLKPLGDSYFQLTRKGLTKELGFVGNYGEVIDWVTQIYEATRPSPDKPGDPLIKAQLVKISRARAPFRYPMLDADGHRAMVQETIVGWRDVHFPGDVTYTQRPSWDGTPVEVAAATLDPVLVGGVQQMDADNQFYQSMAEHMSNKGFRVTAGLLPVPRCLEELKAVPPTGKRLPMSWDQPDFVFSDEEDGVVAIKNGKEILYASLYWRARYAINFLGRVHFITPAFDRIATVKEEIEFTPSNLEYTRPDWTNFGFANGGLRYPETFISAHKGEKLPIARIPDGIAFKPGQENVHAGRGDFYQLRYGPYLIAMNMSAEKTFDLKVPAHSGRIRSLVDAKVAKTGEELKVGPLTTVVLHFD